MWNSIFGSVELNYDHSVHFKINGECFSVSNDVSDGTTLNSYIRDVLNLSGTKFMCYEGGCGACVVAVTAKHPVTKQQHTFAVNSCLTPIWACDGWDIMTVEYLGNKKTGYHPIQATLAHFNGSQCGFCSPGMVMNMFSVMKRGKTPTMAEVENSFGGNLCRCTGYRSILDAFKSLSVDATPELKQACADIEDCYKLCSKSDLPCKKSCETEMKKSLPILIPLENTWWYKVRSVSEIFIVLNKIGDESYKLVAGNTAEGVYRSNGIVVYIDINAVSELRTSSCTSTDCTIGANLTLTETINFFDSCASQTGFSHLQQLARHIEKVANPPIRNVGTVAGNLSIKHQHKEFPSDLFTILEAVGAKLNILDEYKRVQQVTLTDYLLLDMTKKIIFTIRIPSISSPHVFRTFKITPRAENSHAYVNAGFLVKIADMKDWKVVDQPRIVFGGINPSFAHASNLETYLEGKSLLDANVNLRGLAELGRQLIPDHVLPDASPEYRKTLAQALWYKFLLGLDPSKVRVDFRSGANVLERPLSSGKQEFDTDTSKWPLNQPIPKIEAAVQCAGEAEYVNDIPSFPDELHGAFVLTTQASGYISRVDATAALSDPAVVAYLKHSDIEGSATFTPLDFFGYKEEEEIFCSGRVRYSGQAIALVVALSRAAALRGSKKVKVEYKNTEKPVLSLNEVLKHSQGRIQDVNTVKHKNEHLEANDSVDAVIKGEFEIGKQYHFHMETQTCLVVPTEDGFDVFSSTQWTDVTQAAIARTLKIPASKVNVIVRRLGGGFGAKLTKATHVAVACAIAADKFRRPVRIVLPLSDNMEMAGKRFASRSEYEVHVDTKGKIINLDMTLYHENGAYLNDSPMFLALEGMKNCYDAKNWNLNGKSVRTDQVTATFCRAPGTTEGIAMIEEVMENIASTLKLDPVEVRMINMAPGTENAIPAMITELKNKAEYDMRLRSIEQYNLENRWKKRGISIAPMRFSIVYFDNFRANVCLMQSDGSVVIKHGGIEMGQGVNTKAIQIAAHILNVPIDTISVQPTDSSTIPNVFCSAGSITSEAVGYSVKIACGELMQKLEPIKASMSAGATWQQIIKKAFEKNVDLCSGHMFSAKDGLKNYFVHGVCIAEVEIDVLTGERQVLRVDLLEDVGQSLSPMVDVGQIEGAFVMGMGYWLSEELIHDPITGRLLNTRTWNYKPPGAKDIPADFRIYFKKNSSNPGGVFQSKGTGEPATVLAHTCFWAIQHAIKSARRDASSQENYFNLEQPATPEKILSACQSSPDQFTF